MYASSSRLARPLPVGRGASAKRPHSSFPLPPPHRPSARPSLAAGAAASASNPRHRPSGATISAPPSLEETFSLVPGNSPSAFAMLIRLTPHLVDEVKRVESQGGAARIKFDANANNSGGNVIDVGGTEFRFTWSKESGDLCDIYEERRSGEDGSGLLSESGSAWRKLNVQRVLDESTKNHVKKMSEEAERKSKARKAIVLEPGNPSMKSQIKALVAVEATPWKNFKHKKESPMKKQKTESSQVGGPPKSAYKPVLLPVSAVKGRSSSSPLLSHPEQPAAPPSPIGASNTNKTRSSVEDSKPLLKPKDNDPASSDKASLTRTDEPFPQTHGEKGNLGNKPKKLQSFLITLLMENPKGMSLKALEKSVSDKFPDTGKSIEPIIKNIANFQSPGRYYLKPGVAEGSKKPFESKSGNESSPEDNSHQAAIHENTQTLVPEQSFEKESLDSETDHHARQISKVGESNGLEETEIQQNRFDDKGVSEANEGQAGSSSDSGSDSDSESDSSDSGSQRSRSLAGSGSGSSSDSESDASSNSKEGSDEDVDIMTSDDDREPKNQLQSSEPKFSTSHVPLRTPGAVILKSKNHEEDGGNNDFDKLDIGRHTPDGLPETHAFMLADNEGEKLVDNSSFSLDPDELQERQEFIGSLFDERVNPIHDSSRGDHFDGSEKVSGSKSKSRSDLEYLNESYHRTKRFKAGSFGEPSVYEDWDVGLSGSHSDSPSKLKKNSLMDTAKQLSHIDRITNAKFGSQMEYEQPTLGKHQVQPAALKSFNENGREKLPDTAEKPFKSVENSRRGRKNLNKGVSLKKDKSRTHSHKEEASRNDIKVPESLKEGGTGAKQSEPSNSYYQIQNEVGKMSVEADRMSSIIIGSSPKEKNRFGGDKSPIINGKGRVLQRELSDLELGELREQLSEAAPAEKKFERKSSFRQLENRGNTLDNRSSDFNKGKPIKNATSESGRLSPPHATARIPYNLDSSNRKTNADDQSTDLTRHVHSQPQQISRVDQSEVGHPFDRLADANVQSRCRDLPVSQGVGLEGFGESYRKSTMVTSQPDIERAPVFHSIKDSKRLASNSSIEEHDRPKDLVSVEVNNNGDSKRRDASSDENSSYSKYEKSEPEFKGPIKDFSQYKEYVQEYRDKYDSYCSLDKILERYRTKFEKLGRDLESSKGHDAERYSYLLEQLKDSYRKCGMRHKRLKTIFLVLHEELQHIKQRIKDFAVSY